MGAGATNRCNHSKQGLVPPVLGLRVPGSWGGYIQDGHMLHVDSLCPAHGPAGLSLALVFLDNPGGVEGRRAGQGPQLGWGDARVGRGREGGREGGRRR